MALILVTKSIKTYYGKLTNITHTILLLKIQPSPQGEKGKRGPHNTTQLCHLLLLLQGRLRQEIAPFLKGALGEISGLPQVRCEKRIGGFQCCKSRLHKVTSGARVS